MEEAIDLRVCKRGPPPAAGAPWNLLEMQLLWPWARPRGGLRGPALCFNKPCRGPDERLRTTHVDACQRGLGSGNSGLLPEMGLLMGAAAGALGQYLRNFSLGKYFLVEKSTGVPLSTLGLLSFVASPGLLLPWVASQQRGRMRVVPLIRSTLRQGSNPGAPGCRREGETKLATCNPPRSETPLGLSPEKAHLDPAPSAEEGGPLGHRQPSPGRSSLQGEPPECLAGARREDAPSPTVDRTRPSSLSFAALKIWEPTNNVPRGQDLAPVLTFTEQRCPRDAAWNRVQETSKLIRVKTANSWYR